MAAVVYKVALVVILAVIAASVAATIGLSWLGQPTISDWLRVNPWWFAWPAIFMVAFLIGLTLHLIFMG